MPRPVRHATGGSSQRGIFKPEHQSKCPPTDDKPRIWYINPLQAPSGLWSGNLTYTDFELDQNIGVCNSLYLRMSLQFSDPTHRPSCPNTFYALNRAEVYVGSDLVETVYADSLYHESIAFLSEQKAHNVADIHNLNEQDLSPRNMYFATSAALAAYCAANGFTVPTNGIGYEEATGQNQSGGTPVNGIPVVLPPPGVVVQPVVATGAGQAGLSNGQVTETASGYYYINLDNTCLKAAKVYVKGFNAKFKVRVYWATSWTAQQMVNVPGSGSATSSFYSSQPSIGQLQLLVEERTTDAMSLMALEQAHKAGIVDYTVAIRERLQDNPPALVGAQQNTTFLRAFRNKSAGLLMYITQPNPPADRLQQRLAFASIQLLDARGNKLTEILDNDILTSKVFPDQIDSSFPNSANPDIRTVALLPFANHFQPVLDEGCSNGSYQLTTLEQFVLTPDGTVLTLPGKVNPNGETTSVGVNMITIISYSYAHITCMAGNHTIRFET
jgi:hypothetical protein